MALMAAGLAFTTGPATDAIMGALPAGKAGAGSAVNDTTREVGGTLGVAIVGSVLNSAYGSHVLHGLTALGASAATGRLAGQSVVAGMNVAARFPAPLQAAAHDAVSSAFMVGLHRGSFVAACTVAVAGLVALAFLPARAAVVGGPAVGRCAGCRRREWRGKRTSRPNGPGRLWPLHCFGRGVADVIRRLRASASASCCYPICTGLGEDSGSLCTAGCTQRSTVLLSAEEGLAAGAAARYCLSMREVPEDERDEHLRMLREQAQRDAEVLAPRPGHPVYGLAAPSLTPAAVTQYQLSDGEWSAIMLTYGPWGDPKAGPYVAVTTMATDAATMAAGRVGPAARRRPGSGAAVRGRRRALPVPRVDRQASRADGTAGRQAGKRSQPARRWSAGARWSGPPGCCPPIPRRRASW